MRRRQSLLSDAALANALILKRSKSIDWDHSPSRLSFAKGGASIMFSFRLTVDEIELLRERASEQNVSISDLIRNALFARQQKQTA